MAIDTDKTWCPAIEVTETDSSLILKAEIPGMTAKELNIQVSRDRVSITGEHPKHQSKVETEVFPSELHYGQLHCDFPLPGAIEQGQVKAELIDGILTLTMPKIKQQAVGTIDSGR